MAIIYGNSDSLESIISELRLRGIQDIATLEDIESFNEGYAAKRDELYKSAENRLAKQIESLKNELRIEEENLKALKESESLKLTTERAELEIALKASEVSIFVMFFNFIQNFFKHVRLKKLQNSV